MSNPMTPSSRQRTASSAISIERAAWRIAVTSARIVDRVPGRGRVRRPDPEPLEVRPHDLVQRQALLDRQLGRVPHLRVHDAVRGEVLGALGGDPHDGVVVLHDAERVLERLEIQLEALAVRTPPEPGGQLVHVLGRQVGVAVLAREVDDGRRAQAAVEVVVEQRLGRLADRVGRQHPSLLGCGGS